MSLTNSKNTNEQRQKRPYRPSGNAKIGRPTDKTQEEIIANKRRLERDYSIRRGRFITKIKYYEGRYEIPQELKSLTQATEEEVKHKCKCIFDYVKGVKWEGLMQKNN